MNDLTHALVEPSGTKRAALLFDAMIVYRFLPKDFDTAMLQQFASNPVIEPFNIATLRHKHGLIYGEVVSPTLQTACACMTGDT
jgi:hypothetical protein